MKGNWKLLPAALKLTYVYGTQWQNADTCNTNQMAIITLAPAASSCGPSPSLSPTRDEPARTPWGRPAVELVNVNKQSDRAEEQERKKQQLARSFLIPQTPTQQLQDATITHLSFSFIVAFLSSPLLGSISRRLADTVLFQNELMLTINNKARGNHRVATPTTICHRTQYYVFLFVHFLCYDRKHLNYLYFFMIFCGYFSVIIHSNKAAIKANLVLGWQRGFLIVSINNMQTIAITKHITTPYKNVKWLSNGYVYQVLQNCFNIQ